MRSKEFLSLGSQMNSEDFFVSFFVLFELFKLFEHFIQLTIRI